MNDKVITIATRNMVEEDLDRVLLIEKASFLEPWSRNIFLGELENILCYKLVATEGVEIAGYISFAVVCDEVHLRTIAVHEDWKRRGIASQLLSDMIKISSHRGGRYGTLEVRRSNSAALELYKKFGFVVEGVRPSYYSETREDALIMWADFQS